MSKEKALNKAEIAHNPKNANYVKIWTYSCSACIHRNLIEQCKAKKCN